MLQAPEDVEARVQQARRLQLFLDYDGTLADFAPTPEHIEPQSEIIALLTKLADHRSIRVTLISGRRLAHVEELLPVPGLLLTGTYGIEMRLPNGKRVDRVPDDTVRPVLERIKPRWKQLIAEREGFFLEDKGWALAMHARHAAGDEAEEVLEQARQIATSLMQQTDSHELFRTLGGHRFLEIGPTLAHKGKTVGYLLDRYRWPDALLLYIGDDDKDEEAFGVIHAHGGLAIKVCEEPCRTEADGRLASPSEVRRWLSNLCSRLRSPDQSSPTQQPD